MNDPSNRNFKYHLSGKANFNFFANDHAGTGARSPRAAVGPANA